jgi:cellulose synthase/poly-beta-1,6-N-acetylglucosamine synthase-like glycosyltransferase
MNNKQVDILLSVYNPNEEYLIKQLISLNNQTYPNLKLYIFDDCIKKRCNLDLFEKYTDTKITISDVQTLKKDSDIKRNECSSKVNILLKDKISFDELGDILFGFGSIISKSIVFENN